jgi:hypothetical protein
MMTTRAWEGNSFAMEVVPGTGKGTEQLAPKRLGVEPSGRVL